MLFKLAVFIGILIVITVLGMRAYAASIRGFEARLAQDTRLPEDAGPG